MRTTIFCSVHLFLTPLAWFSWMPQVLVSPPSIHSNSNLLVSPFKLGFNVGYFPYGNFFSLCLVFLFWVLVFTMSLWCALLGLRVIREEGALTSPLVEGPILNGTFNYNICAIYPSENQKINLECRRGC